MTAREIDLLREFLGREIKHVRDEVRELRDDVRKIATVVDALEDDDQVEHGRREFKRTLIRGLITAQAAMVGLIGLALAAAQQFGA